MVEKSYHSGVKFNVLTGFLVLLAAPVSGHPHIFADENVEIEVQGTQLKGFWTQWEFDVFFSNEIRTECGVTHEGACSPQETLRVQKGYFNYLVNSHYYTYAWNNGKSLSLTATKFTTWSDAGRMVFRWFVPIERAIPQGTQLILSFYDEEFYTDFHFREESPWVVTGAESFTCSGVIQENPEVSFYGVIHPKDLMIDLRPKSKVPTTSVHGVIYRQG